MTRFLLAIIALALCWQAIPSVFAESNGDIVYQLMVLQTEMIHMSGSLQNIERYTRDISPTFSGRGH